MTTNQKINIGLKVINVVAKFIYDRKTTTYKFRPLTKKRVEGYVVQICSNTVKKLT